MTQSTRPEDGLSGQRRQVREIVATDDPAKMVTLAKEHGEQLRREGLKTSQVRSIFGTARAIEGMWLIDPTRARRELLKLKPKLAYQGARMGGAVVTLAQLLEPAIDAVNDDKERFLRFLDYFEALLAYHRAAGGDD